ncbi:RHS repeat-associated core domain-containing protein [Inediibacterium massiliense]|uniref:RHS repeat-associated core domain-containing protein n=1 Tax=Inediibacterium massiliense TaxID=1658111 RepID=UPI0006B678AD|nr:RHS repeat-associated core domain-containing protein [Inediibacterium massiliense]
MVDKNGNKILYTYDLRNLLLTKEIPKTGEYISYDYDSVGNKICMYEVTGRTIYDYDDKNQLINITKDYITKNVYCYDKIGNIVSVEDEKGFKTTYTYDKSSRMITVSYDVLGTTKTITYDYDENGNRKAINYEGGITEEYNYDQNNNLTTIINRKSNGDILSSYSYIYDLESRKKAKTDHYGTTYYEYYSTGQIKTVEEPDKTSIYKYDHVGNREHLRETYKSHQVFNELPDNKIKYRIKDSWYKYSKTNMLLILVENMKSVSNDRVIQKITHYTYDKNENQLTETSEYIKPRVNKDEIKPNFQLSIYGDSINTPIDPLIYLVKNQYDGFNRLKKIESIKGGKRTIILYEYDGDNLRTRKIVKNSSDGYIPKETNYLYDRQHVILETNKDHLVIARYVRGINYISRIDSQDHHSYYLYNGHGDVVQTVSEAGNIENEYNYDIFGKVTLSKEKYTNPIRYAGEFFDEEAGLYYLRARYYNPYIGRFISEDSYWGEDTNPLSLNLYTYCYNDPMNYIDPTGHWPSWNKVKSYAKSAYKSITKAASKSSSSNKRSKKRRSSSRNSGTTIGAAIGTVIGGPVGGAEAISNAVATNKDAIIFNPAVPNLDEYGLKKKKKKYRAHMTQYIVIGEFLDNTYRSWGISRPIGHISYLPKQSDDPVENHSMGAVKKGIREKKIDSQHINYNTQVIYV